MLWKCSKVCRNNVQDANRNSMQYKLKVIQIMTKFYGAAVSLWIFCVLSRNNTCLLIVITVYQRWKSSFAIQSGNRWMQTIGFGIGGVLRFSAYCTLRELLRSRYFKSSVQVLNYFDGFPLFVRPNSTHTCNKFHLN